MCPLSLESVKFTTVKGTESKYINIFILNINIYLEKLWIKKISTQIEKNLWRPVSHNLILALKAIFKSLRLKKLPTDFDDLFFCFTCFSLYFNATVWYFQFYSYFLIYSGISCKKRKRKITFGKIFIKTNVIEIFNF